MRATVAVLAALALAGAAAHAEAQASGAYAAAVADPARPAADRARDAARHPAELLAFARVAPGQTVVDLIPGGGYFTRLFSAAVGPSGHVYAVVPDKLAADHPQAVEAIHTAADGLPNVTVRVDPLSAAPPRAGLIDLVWTSQNYHDVHNPKLPPGDALVMDKAIFAALKPGGAFVVVDHAAAPGSGARDAGTLHRIDPEVVTREATAAGFRPCGASEVLRNPADAHTASVFDPSIRGRTDQFALRFCKPA